MAAAKMATGDIAAGGGAALGSDRTMMAATATLMGTAVSAAAAGATAGIRALGRQDGMGGFRGWSSTGTASYRGSHLPSVTRSSTPSRRRHLLMLQPNCFEQFEAARVVLCCI
jgi:hypothetical protein